MKTNIFLEVFSKSLAIVWHEMIIDERLYIEDLT